MIGADIAFLAADLHHGDRSLRCGVAVLELIWGSIASVGGGAVTASGAF